MEDPLMKQCSICLDTFKLGDKYISYKINKILYFNRINYIKHKKC